MKLCLDVGNSQLCGGVFKDNNLLFQFRYDSKQINSSDQFGIFLRTVFRENNHNYAQLSKIGIASVVPSVDYTVRAACIKYLNISPIFLQSHLNMNISIKTHNSQEVGSDLIAGAIAACSLYPNKDIIIFDLGTATTASYISHKHEYLGVSITPGCRLMATTLQNDTAKLFGVDILIPEMAIGKNTKLSIQSGIYYAQLGFMRQIIIQTIAEYSLSTTPIIIGTGGFAHLFASQNIFHYIISELVLLGIKNMIEQN